MHKGNSLGKPMDLVGKALLLSTAHPPMAFGFLSRHPTVVALLGTVLNSGSFVILWLLFDFPWFLVSGAPSGLQHNESYVLAVADGFLCLTSKRTQHFNTALQCPAARERGLWEPEVPQLWQGAESLPDSPSRSTWWKTTSPTWIYTDGCSRPF